MTAFGKVVLLCLRDFQVKFILIVAE